MEPEERTCARARAPLPCQGQGAAPTSTRLVEGTGSRPGQRGCANGAPGGLAFELGASQAEDRGWGPMSLKTGAGGATGFALLVKADFISLRPLAAVRETDWSQGERDRVREEEEEEGGDEKAGGRWSVHVCACAYVCTRVCVMCACVYVCVCACACMLAGVKSRN